MYEVAVLGSGKHFGELALTTNKPRAATVKCIIGTHLMALSKHDYSKVLLRFEEANLYKFIDFLRQMPHFRQWKKNALSRLTYYMPRATYMRNQIVFKEGDQCCFVYVVLQGEFEITKLIKPVAEKDEHWNFYIGPLREKSGINERLVKHINKNPGYLPQRITIIGVGNMIGEEDASQERGYTSTCKCLSQNGVLLAIKTNDFFFRVKTNEDTWKYIEKSAKFKDYSSANTINKSFNINKEIKTETK